MTALSRSRYGLSQTGLLGPSKGPLPSAGLKPGPLFRAAARMVGTKATSRRLVKAPFQAATPRQSLRIAGMVATSEQADPRALQTTSPGLAHPRCSRGRAVLSDSAGASLELAEGYVDYGIGGRSDYRRGQPLPPLLHVHTTYSVTRYSSDPAPHKPSQPKAARNPAGRLKQQL